MLQEKLSSKEKMKRGLYNSKMDPVGKADADIDNDGDVDKSDKYLHNRRKAISKNIKKNKGETATMNPKLDTGKGKSNEMEQKEAQDLDTANATRAIKHDCASHVEHAEWGMGECIKGEHTIVETSPGEGYVTHYDVMFEHGIERDVPVAEMKIIKSSSHGHMRKKKSEQKESRIRQALKSVLEAQNHNPNKDKAEKPEDALKGAGAKQMKKDHEDPGTFNDLERQSHDDASKAGRAGPSRKMRPNDNSKGDSKVINPPADETKKGKGSSEVKEKYDTMAGLKSAYASMYEVKEEAEEASE